MDIEINRTWPKCNRKYGGRNKLNYAKLIAKHIKANDIRNELRRKLRELYRIIKAAS